MKLKDIAIRIAEDPPPAPQVSPEQTEFEFDYELNLKGPFKSAQGLNGKYFEYKIEADEGLLITGDAYLAAMQELQQVPAEDLQKPDEHTFLIEVTSWDIEESDPSVGLGDVRGEKFYEAESWTPVAVDGLMLQSQDDVYAVTQELDHRIDRYTLRDWGAKYQKHESEMGGEPDWA